MKNNFFFNINLKNQNKMKKLIIFFVSMLFLYACNPALSFEEKQVTVCPAENDSVVYFDVNVKNTGNKKVVIKAINMPCGFMMSEDYFNTEIKPNSSFSFKFSYWQYWNSGMSHFLLYQKDDSGQLVVFTPDNTQKIIVFFTNTKHQVHAVKVNICSNEK